MDNLEDILDRTIPIVGILSTIALPIILGFVFAKKNMTAKHTERMELIKQGIIPSEQSKPMPNRYRSLRNGFLCIGIALGIIISFIVIRSMNLAPNEGIWVVIASTLLFLGIAYIGFYMITKKNTEMDDTLD